MPINFLATVYVEGRGVIPFYDTLKVWVPIITVVGLLKWYFAGARNTWERDMHGRVVLITGGTSGLGAVTAKSLAERGAQVILLVRNIHDGWLTEYVDDLRESTGNPLVFAEEANLEDLYSVRKFATKWIDNLPPRRLDMVVCCAAVMQPPSLPRQITSPDGVEPQFQVNYLAHYLLLTVLAPALRSQPPDREVRVILTSCISSVMADLDTTDLGFMRRSYPEWKPHLVAGEAKLCLALTGYELQRQFDTYERNAPPNVHVAVVDPGMMRSPSFKRWFTLGRVWMLAVYLALWPFWWLFLKSSVDGAQSMLYAIMSPDVADNDGVSYISDCRIRAAPPRSEFKSEERQKKVFTETAKMLEAVEKRSAVERNKLKPELSEEERSAAQGKAKAKAKAAEMMERAQSAGGKTSKPKKEKARKA